MTAYIDGNYLIVFNNKIDAYAITVKIFFR